VKTGLDEKLAKLDKKLTQKTKGVIDDLEKIEHQFDKKGSSKSQKSAEGHSGPPADDTNLQVDE